MRGSAGEAGQASTEWVGLVLVVVLSLGVLAAIGVRPGRAPASDRALGEAVAGRLVCAARGSCAGSVEPSLAGAAPLAPRTSAEGPRLVRGVSRRRALDALRRLRSVGAKLVKRAWIVCIGYRRFRYELEHPRLPNEAMPLEEAIDIANGCLNPYGFLVEDE
jgi:hypothetical protein